MSPAPTVRLPGHRPGFSRRRLLLGAALGAVSGLGICASAHADAPAPVVSGEHVQWLGPALRAPARRIVLVQSRMLPALSMVDPAITDKLVGWTSDFSTMYAAEYAAWVRKYPRLGALPVVGRSKMESLSVESILALQPDLLIISRRVAGAPSTYAGNVSLNLLVAAGIPVLVVDFFVNPLDNTLPGMQALAQCLGTAGHVRPFIDNYTRRLEHIRQTLQTARPQIPRVFVHAHAGSADCCFSPGQGSFSEFVRLAGGHNIGSDLLKTATGQVAREMVLSLQPDVYIATGTDTLHGTGKLLIGPGIDAATAASGLRDVIATSQLQALNAVRTQRAHGFWHGFNDTPAHLVLIEVLAQWLHPELFADLRPLQTLDELNHFFQVPLQGTFWSSLPTQAPDA